MLKFIGFEFHLYGFILGLAALAGFTVSQWLANKRKISEKLIEEAFWWMLILGVIGARIYHVIDLWGEFYRFNPLNTIYLWQGGLGIFGGIVGGVLGLLLFWRFRTKKNIPLLSLLDLAAFGLPLAQSIGRLGNFFNNELWGIPTNLPWGIYTPEGVKVHPLFLYESLSCLILFLILFKISGRKELPAGRIFSFYLIGYGLIRFFLEPLRPQEIVWSIGGVPTAQIFAFGGIILGLLMLYILRIPRQFRRPIT